MKQLLYLKDEQLKDLIEKLFISYREIFADSRKILDKYSIGLAHNKVCLLYTSDAADDTPCVDLGGRRIIKKK